MPVSTFNGKCFVAFTDISGFKAMMKNGDQAIKAMDRFYNAGYQALQSERRINGFFVSDCGILFSRSGGSSRQQLDAMLAVVRRLNRSVLHKDIMLTTSIAWGDFSYHNRIEFEGIRKQPIYGNAYVSAFLDSETGLPRLRPGQCRISLGGVPELADSERPSQFVLKTKGKYSYFYWMLDHENQIASFEALYKDAYNLQFAGMLRALKQPADLHMNLPRHEENGNAGEPSRNRVYLRDRG